MKKIIICFLLSYGITTTSTAQDIDSTLLLLDKTDITNNVFYPYLENDTTSYTKNWLNWNNQYFINCFHFLGK